MAAHARAILCKATRQRQFVPPLRLAAFDGLAQAIYLSVPMGRVMCRELYDLSTQRGWSSRYGVRLS